MGAVISRVRIAAAHEGVAELVRFSNGGQSEVPLDYNAGERLLRSCGVDQIDGLVGQSWEHVRDALYGAYNNLN